jgi:glycosyltransferase involved in cell wall biosynthesis
MGTPGLGFVTFGTAIEPTVTARLVDTRPLLHSNWTCYPRSIMRLSAFLDWHRPDALVAFGPQPLIVASEAARRSVRPPRLGYVEITRPLQAASVGESPFRRRFAAWMFRRALRRVDIAAANSIDGLAELTAIVSPGGPEIRVVRNPVDIEAWSMPLAPVHTGPLRLLSSGRLVKSKGFSDLLEAAAPLVDRFAFTLSIAGTGPELERLRRQASALGLGKRVHFLGWLSDPRAAMREADVFVFPSHYEGFPNAVLEAMAASRPVVSSFWGTDARHLHAAGVVLGHEAGDIAAMTAALAAIIESPARRATLASCGKAHAAQFAAAHVAADYDALFHDLASCRT